MLPDVGVGTAVGGSNRDVSVGEWDDGNPKLRDTDEAICIDILCHILVVYTLTIL